MQIRPFEEDDWAATWQIIEPVFRAGETYAFSPDITEAEAHKVWLLRAPRIIGTQIPAYQMVEFVVGEATLDIPTDEIAALFAEWLDRSNG